MNRPFRSIQNGKVIYTVARPTGRALERALAQAARENRQVEMDRLSESTAAFTARMFVAAVIRRRANDREVSRARSIIEVAHRWRTALGQSLDGPVAFHLGKKLLKEQIDHDLSMQVVGRKSNENRDEAMTQLLALLEPAKRVSVHADLLSYVHDLAAMARMVAPSYADGAQLTREVLQALGRRRSRLIEQSGFTFLGRASVQAQSFDSIESGYDTSLTSYA